MSTADLADALGRSDLRVLDGSWFLDGRDAQGPFRDAHIPGAGFFDIEAISDQSSPLPHMLPSPEAFAEAVGGLGVRESDHVVVYDQSGLFSAARVWWSLRAMGMDRVQVLDGGLPKWIAEGRPTASGPAVLPPTVFKARYRPALVRDFNAVCEIVHSGAEQVADARSNARFKGEAPEPRAGVRSGHMPGAFSLPFGELLNPDGTMKPAAALARVIVDAGLSVERPTTVSCGSGVTAPILALAFARLGNWNVAVYDGSWTDWGSRADAEIVTGP